MLLYFIDKRSQFRRNIMCPVKSVADLMMDSLNGKETFRVPVYRDLTACETPLYALF